MDLKVSSPKPGLSPTDCVGNPEEKEISEDDDDDRNHKHRRRDARSLSLEGDTIEPVLPRPFRKRNRPFENGYRLREGNSQIGETWKCFNMTNQEKDLSGRFDKRRTNVASFSRAPGDLNQRMRGNQFISSELAPIRSRVRDSGLWGPRDSRFSSVDIASQLVQQASMPHNLFLGRGLPNSSMQSASWNAFGLVPPIPNSGLDTLHPIGLQGTLRPSISPPVNLGIPRQRCRDFEERGFCLRGDMCLMEHGVNRIVVEDVQSLSQFNLPVSLPNPHLLGTPAGQGHLPGKGFHNKSSKLGISDDALGLNGVGSSELAAADLYDPDQPLWTNDSSETSPELLALNSSNIEEIEPFLDLDVSNHNHIGKSDGSEYERPIKIAGIASGSQSSSVWGRIGCSKSKLEARGKVDSTLASSSRVENEMKKDMEFISGAHGIPHQGRKVNADDAGVEVMGLSLKPQSDSGRNLRKLSQKAFRTLFVSGIPLKENKREALLSHFQKFGEVIDIYIPLNSERAFVQFSKREEAEAALKAPDAVMGNRFIKLWWANRDSIPDDGISGVSNVLVNPKVMPTLAPPFSTSKGIDNAHISGPKNDTNMPFIQSPASDHSKPSISSTPRTPPPQKKLEDLELLKEELRKKQEMLDRKRNEFKRQLDKLQKQATGLKDEVASDQLSKMHTSGVVVHVAKSEILKSSDYGTVVLSPQAETTSGSCRSVEYSVAPCSKSYSTVTVPESSSLKPSIHPLAPLGSPFSTNRYKLDNRPTAFKVLLPLPTGLANVSALKEHFSSYGDLSLVEMEGFEPQDSDKVSEPSKFAARISFTTRHSAERAFFNGKCWQGQNLQFTWCTLNGTSSKDNAMKENLPASEECLDANIQSAGEFTTTGFQTTAAFGNGESENLVSGEFSMANVDPDNDSKSASSKISDGKLSP